MRITRQEYEALLAKNPGLRPRPSNEEQQDDLPGKADHKARKAKVDAKSHPSYRISIDFLVSDNLGRDCDGAQTTLLDCLIRSARRLSTMDF